jgi:hypothetical protein
LSRESEKTIAIVNSVKKRLCDLLLQNPFFRIHSGSTPGWDSTRRRVKNLDFNNAEIIITFPAQVKRNGNFGTDHYTGGFLGIVGEMPDFPPASISLPSPATPKVGGEW